MRRRASKLGVISFTSLCAPLLTGQETKAHSAVPVQGRMRSKAPTSARTQWKTWPGWDQGTCPPCPSALRCGSVTTGGHEPLGLP